MERYARTLSEATARLSDPVRVEEDRIREAQLRPIPGQLRLPLGTATFISDARTLLAALNTRASIRDCY